MLLSLLGVFICFRDAQFIGVGIDFASLISNRMAEGITAKLGLSNWLQLRLTNQKMPHGLDDTIGAFNLKNLLQHHRFHLLTIYRN